VSRITPEMLPVIEKALGFELYENVKLFLVLEEDRTKRYNYIKQDRRTGGTIAYCINLALSEGVPLDFTHFDFIDEWHGLAYKDWFRRTFLDIWNKLGDAGLEVRPVILTKTHPVQLVSHRCCYYCKHCCKANSGLCFCMKHKKPVTNNTMCKNFKENE